MNLYLKEITIDDKIEILKMIEEIKKGDDLEKFEGLSNMKEISLIIMINF